MEEIGSQDTDDEEHSANAEIEDEFLQVLDQLDDDQKANLLGKAIEEYGKKLFINHEEQRDDLLFAALQIDASFVDLARAIKHQSEVVDVEDEDDDDSQDDDEGDDAPAIYSEDEDDAVSKQDEEITAGEGEEDGGEEGSIEGEDDPADAVDMEDGGEDDGLEEDGDGDGGEED